MSLPPDPSTTRLLSARDTERLNLRRWDGAHADEFAEMNADPEVMRFLNGGVGLSREESNEVSDHIAAHWEDYGFGLWAAIERSSGEMIGFLGICHPLWHPQHVEAVEVGWRLRRRAWGRGYATEGARASLEAGFGELGLDQILAFVHPQNGRSRAVMRRLGMTFLAAEEHPTRHHAMLVFGVSP
jgi:RimJ/RimL family protein N-acetyltransferase